MTDYPNYEIEPGTLYVDAAATMISRAAEFNAQTHEDLLNSYIASYNLRLSSGTMNATPEQQERDLMEWRTANPTDLDLYASALNWLTTYIETYPDNDRVEEAETLAGRCSRWSGTESQCANGQSTVRTAMGCIR